MTTVSATVWSAVWVEAAPERILDNGSQNGLGAHRRWVKQFDESISRADRTYAPPWLPGGLQRFWSNYLGTGYRTTAGSDAWQKLVPLRVPRGPSQGTAEVFLDRYVWPHAAGSVLTLQLSTPDGTAGDAAQAVVGAVHSDTYELPSVLGSAKPAKATPSLKAALADLLPPSAERAPAPPSPFTIATVLMGDANERATPEQNKEIWRAVYAMANPSENWRSVPLPPAAEHRVSMRADPSQVGGGLYGLDRGRTVWQPRRFSSARSQSVDGLVCYHRNLVALTLVVEAHLALLRWAHTRLDNLTFEAEGLVRSSAESLADLYLGQRPGTYASASTVRHIDDDDVDAVADVWSHFGLLHACTRAAT